MKNYTVEALQTFLKDELGYTLNTEEIFPNDYIQLVYLNEEGDIFRLNDKLAIISFEVNQEFSLKQALSATKPRFGGVLALNHTSRKARVYPDVKTFKTEFPPVYREWLDGLKNIEFQQFFA